MRTALRTTLLLAACTGPGPTDDDDTDETDVEDTDDTDDTDVEDTDDTDVEDTDDTDVANLCTLTDIPAGTQATGEPDVGDVVRYRRRIEVCVSDMGLAGRWHLKVTNQETGDTVCAFMVEMTGTTKTEACDDCDLAFSDVTYTGPTFSDADLCALFGYDDLFVAGLNSAYAGIGTTLTPDIFFDTMDGWNALDEDPTTDRTRTAHDDADHVAVDFAFSYGWD